MMESLLAFTTSLWGLQLPLITAVLFTRKSTQNYSANKHGTTYCGLIFFRSLQVKDRK